MNSDRRTHQKLRLFLERIGRWLPIAGDLRGWLACCTLLRMVASAQTETWTFTSAPVANWSAVASSADGIKLVAAADGGLIYTSTNSGQTWTPSIAPATNWQTLASSADGTKLVAGARGGLIYLSADSAESWIPATSPVMNWQSVGSSADGTKVIAAGVGSSGGAVFISRDAGVTWFSNATTFSFNGSVACSSDGSKLALAVAFGAVYTSTNSGANWIQSLPSDDSNPTSVSFSADGTKLLVAYDFINGSAWGSIIQWTNLAASWTPTGAPVAAWHAVAFSADGTKVAAVNEGSIYTSTDSAATWRSNNAPAMNWSWIASSADGGKLVAAVKGGGIYTSSSAPAPQLSLASSVSNLVLSWVVPSRDFALQENSDLVNTNWADVPATAVLNLTNLQFQTIMPSTAVSRFYRLKH